MTCDNVFRKILDNAFNKFTSDSFISSYESFVESVVDFFSEGCGKDLHDLYTDYEFHCANYLNVLSDGYELSLGRSK